MERLGQWLLGVIACAALAGAARQLCPEGAGKNAVRFTGGLLILLAILSPLVRLSPDELFPEMPDYRETVANLKLELSQRSERTLSEGIAEQLAAYIEDKAYGMGIEVEASVTVTTRDGAVVPESVRLRGGYSEALAEWIVSELGIAKEKLKWTEKG